MTKYEAIEELKELGYRAATFDCEIISRECGECPFKSIVGCLLEKTSIACKAAIGKLNKEEK